MTELLTDADLLTILAVVSAARRVALHLMLNAHDEQPDLPLSAACRKALEARLDDATRTALEELLGYCETHEGARR